MKPITQADLARKAINESGMKDGITSAWLASMLNTTNQKAGNILRGMMVIDEVEIQCSMMIEGHKVNKYRLTKQFKGCIDVTHITPDQAAISAFHAMAGWKPGPVRFFSVGSQP